MKTKLLLMFLIVNLSSIYSQKTNTTKLRSTEIDTLTVAQTMFDDQNFVMAFPYLSQLQKNHPEENLFKYMTGICSLFNIDTYEQGLSLLLEVYESNKKAENIEFYIALAYNYNTNFDDAIVMVNKYLNKKHISNAQRREAEKLKMFCEEGKILTLEHDGGKLDDYIRLSLASEE